MPTHLAHCALYARRLAARALPALAALLVLAAGMAVMQPAAAQQRFEPRGQGRGGGGAGEAASVMDRQAGLVRRAVEALEPRTPGRTNVYFVGAALYATQDVFIRELKSARSIVDERLGTRGRSLLLINHRSTVADTPLASVTNLEDTLGQLSQVMDREQDILFLFLTSHGTRGVLQVDFPRYNLRDLTSERLAQALRRSGIRNKVVVISACYSGSFIPALRDESTMVITASSASRTSFGCSNEREWTYFGDAFFDRALRRTSDLFKAFDLAKGTIDRWEREQGLTPSQPQLYAGEAIRDKLATLRPLASLREPVSELPAPRRVQREAVR
jgi:hypothetical protein